MPGDKNAYSSRWSGPWPRLLPLAAWVPLLLSACASHDSTPTYRYYVTGNAADVVTATRGLVVMQGGGDDVDENYVRMGEYAGGGDFLVLRASGEDDYNDYIHALCGCDSVETIVFNGRAAASDDFVLEKIQRAEALFIAGGDQSNYVRFWKDTAVQDAINAHAAKPAPIGGTSAGMAVLGEFVYAAMSPASLESATALANPYHEDVTLERGFLALPGLKNIITDQHLIERDRIGRTVTLLARLVQDGWTGQARAIAADRETAVHFDPVSGTATVHATADHETPWVYFLRTEGNPAMCRADTPLSIDDISVYRVAPGGSFDVYRWTGQGGLAYSFDVETGRLASSRDSIY